MKIFTTQEVSYFKIEFLENLRSAVILGFIPVIIAFSLDIVNGFLSPNKDHTLPLLQKMFNALLSSNNLYIKITGSYLLIYMSLILIFKILQQLNINVPQAVILQTLKHERFATAFIGIFNIITGIFLSLTFILLLSEDPYSSFATLVTALIFHLFTSCFTSLIRIMTDELVI